MENIHDFEHLNQSENSENLKSKFKKYRAEKPNIYKVLFCISLFVIIGISAGFSTISRSGKDTQIYYPTPSITEIPIQITEEFCGGITGKKCSKGYQCQLDGNYPDAGGNCLPEAIPKKYSCPDSEWIDCMPSPDKPTNYQCEKPYLDWAKDNCLNFKGAAL